MHKAHPGNQRYILWTFGAIAVKFPGYVPNPGRLRIGRERRAERAVRLRKVGEIDWR